MICLIETKRSLLEIIKRLKIDKFEYNIIENHHSKSLSCDLNNEEYIIQINIWENHMLETNVCNLNDVDIEVNVYEQVDIIEILEIVAQLLAKKLD